MDLGLTGRTALVCASSKGLGLACATSLAREGCAVVLNSRSAENLAEGAAQLLAETGVTARTVVADLNHAQGRATLLAACPDADILINNNGGPSPGPFGTFERDAWLAALDSNLLAAVDMIRGLLPGMQARKFGRIVNITSAMVKSPHPMMTLSTAPRAALTAVAKAVSRDVAKDNVTINNMLPERLDTDRQKFMAVRMAGERGISPEEIRRQITAQLPARRYGEPKEFGDMCAFLCSAQAGFITGQNIHLDGGSYEGLV